MSNDSIKKRLLAVILLFTVAASVCAIDRTSKNENLTETTDSLVLMPIETDPTYPVDTNDKQESVIVYDQTDLRTEVRDAWLSLYPENQSLPRWIAGDVEWRTDVTCALLTGDGAALAEILNIPPEVYVFYDSLEINDWSVRNATIENYNPTNEYPLLDITVAASDVPGLPVGEQTLFIEVYPQYVITVLDDGKYPMQEYSSAQSFVRSRIDYEPRFGICDFIVGRLDTLAGNYEPRTRDEIEEYAKVCLGLEPDELKIDEELFAEGGGYQRYGRGGISYVTTMLGEEVRGDMTVVTVIFWADFSRTVEAKVVEYYLEPTDIDWKLTDTLTIRDSRFGAAVYSV